MLIKIINKHNKIFKLRNYKRMKFYKKKILKKKIALKNPNFKIIMQI